MVLSGVLIFQLTIANLHFSVNSVTLQNMSTFSIHPPLPTHFSSSFYAFLFATLVSS